MAVIKSTVARKTVTHVLVSRLAGFCALFGDCRSFLAQAKELLVLRVMIFGHEDRARRRLHVPERIGLQPGRKCGAVLVSKAPLEELRRLLLATELGGEPIVEG